MEICRSVSELEGVLNYLKNAKSICDTGNKSDRPNTIDEKASVGFVPTMGALHRGHISLVNSSVQQASITVVSIFVNPTQFNNASDLEKYPRNTDSDCKLLEAAGADIAFIPGVEDIYPEGVDFSGMMPKVAKEHGLNNPEKFDFEGLDNYGEGPRRPGHFYGVAQVVTRLFDIVKPDFAFFGEKDFQQLEIIKHITRILDYPVRIIACPTLREDDGLAMSSRNMLLSAQQREIAPEIYKNLLLAREMARAEKHKKSGEKTLSPKELAELISAGINEVKGLEVEYAEVLNVTNLQPVQDWNEAIEVQMCVAVYARPVRLIDNIKLI